MKASKSLFVAKARKTTNKITSTASKDKKENKCIYGPLKNISSETTIFRRRQDQVLIIIFICEGNEKLDQ
jgi:hypothetical protein